MNPLAQRPGRRRSSPQLLLHLARAKRSQTDDIDPSATAGVDPTHPSPSFTPGTQLKSTGDAAYTLERLLHHGPRSRVWSAADAATGREVVLKVLDMRTPELRRRALREAQMLRRIQPPPAADSHALAGAAAARAVGGGSSAATGAVRLLQLLDWFPAGSEAMVLVLEPLHESAAAVLHYLGQRSRHGLPLPAVRNLARQLLQALDVLHSKHGICHRDVKPSNLLLATPFVTRPAPVSAPADSSPVKARARSMTLGEVCAAPWRLVDFGNAAPLARRVPWDAPAAAEPAPYDTPPYAPPEAVLHLPTGAAADVWAAGCTVYEAATGARLFDPREGPGFSSDAHHLWLVRQLLGPLPLKLLDRSDVANEWFDDRGVLHVEPLLGVAPTNLQRRLGDDTALGQEEVEGLAAFLAPMLTPDPGRRASAAQMLQHPWLAGGA